MAPRTYLRKRVPANISKSAMAVNALFAANMVKKCHSRGQHINDSSSLSDNSMHLNKTDDTFTRIARGENYNNVCFTKNRVPYDSYALSRSTVDIQSLLMQSDGSSKLKLGPNNCSSMKDGCISKSLILIQSWEEPKHRFVTQRKKSRRKAINSIVKAKTKCSNSSRMFASNNESNLRQNKSGARLSNRLSERDFKNFSTEDGIRASTINGAANNSFSLIEKAPLSTAEMFFDHEIQDQAKSLRYSHVEFTKQNTTQTEILLPAARLQDTSTQNDSHIPSFNNSICVITSTPRIKPRPYHKNLGESIAASPIVTRQTRARTYMRQHKTDTIYTSINTKYCENSSHNICKDYPIVKRQSLKKTPTVKSKTFENSPMKMQPHSKSTFSETEIENDFKAIPTSSPVRERILRPRSCPPKNYNIIQDSNDAVSIDSPTKRNQRSRNLKAERGVEISSTSEGVLLSRICLLKKENLILDSNDEVLRDTPAEKNRRSRSSKIGREVEVFTASNKMLRRRSYPSEEVSLNPDSIDEVSINDPAKRHPRSRSSKVERVGIDMSTASSYSKMLLRTRNCSSKREFALEMSLQRDEDSSVDQLIKRRRSPKRTPRKTTITQQQELEEGCIVRQVSSLKSDLIDENTSVRESALVLTNRSRSLDHRSKHEYLQTEELPTKSPGQKRNGEAWVSYIYEDSVERGPVGLRTRSRSRSLGRQDFSWINFSKHETCDSINVVSTKSWRKSPSGAMSKSSASEKIQTNKENINQIPTDHILRRRMTIAEEISIRNDKTAYKNATSTTNLQRARTRLQSKLLLQSTENLTDMKCQSRNQSPEPLNNNTADLINRNNTNIKNELEIDLKRLKNNQTPAPFNRTDSRKEIISINSTIECSSIKQEAITEETYERDATPLNAATDRLNYSIEDPSSPDTGDNIERNFLPLSHGTPRANSEDVVTSIKQSPLSSVASNRDNIESDCLYINNVKQQHEFAIPSMVAVQRKLYCPGKKYRRSIFSMRRESVFAADDCARVLNTSSTSTNCEKRRSSVKLVPISLQQNAYGTNNVETEESGSQKHLLQTRSSVHVGGDLIEQEVHSFERSGSLLDESVNEEVAAKTAREIVLRNCNQNEPEPWQTYYPDSVLNNCSKIGEGVYGEVFMFRNVKRTTSVMKVIPIEGNQIVNGEPQKKFQDVLSEIIIAKNLSSLTTSGFNHLEAVHLVCGAYPEKLLDHWYVYDEIKGSENDCPDKFQTDGQLYLVLQLEHGGKDLESYKFKNSMEAYSVFVQLAHSLTQAEEHFAFEHRDLHWGNVLISECPTASSLTYTTSDSVSYTVNTRGVRCNIIDFTLSRMTVPRGEGVVETASLPREQKDRAKARDGEEDWVLFNDLKEDVGLFEGEGDVQFDVYRQMRTETEDDWRQFCPKTNVYWLNYILQKMLTEIEYSHPKSQSHKTYLNKMRRCRSRILTFSRCADVVKSLS